MKNMLINYKYKKKVCKCFDKNKIQQKLRILEKKDYKKLKN